jgi:hypothetical protein
LPEQTIRINGFVNPEIRMECWNNGKLDDWKHPTLPNNPIFLLSNIPFSRC